MRKIALVALLVPSIAFGAAATWAPVSTTDLCQAPGRTFSNGNCRSTVATCAAGTSCDAPTLATQGTDLSEVGSVSFYVCAVAGQTITDGAGLTVYLYDPAVGVWSLTDMTLTVPTGSRCAYAKGDSPGIGIPILLPYGRIAAVPTAMATSSGALTITIRAVGLAGQAL